MREKAFQQSCMIVRVTKLENLDMCLDLDRRCLKLTLATVLFDDQFFHIPCPVYCLCISLFRSAFSAYSIDVSMHPSVVSTKYQAEPIITT